MDNCATDLLGDDLDAGGDDLVILGVVDADALVDVGPGLGEAGEEIVAGDDDDAPLLQSLVKLLVCDRQARKPHPDEERPLRLVDIVVHALEAFVNLLQHLLRFGLVERPDDLAADAEDLAGTDQSLMRAGPTPPGARLITALTRATMSTISWRAMTIPVRTPGRPSLDRLMQTIVFSFHRGSASVNTMFGNGMP